MKRYNGKWQCWGRTEEQLRIARAILNAGLPKACQHPSLIAEEAGVNRMRVRHIFHHMRKQEVIQPLLRTMYGVETETVYLSNRATVYVPGPKWWEWVAHNAQQMRKAGMTMEVQGDSARASG